MSIQANQHSGTAYLTCTLLPVPHGMFLRAGGTSTGELAGLNLSSTVGDQPERVAANRNLALQALGLRHLISARQVHGDRILHARPEHRDTEQDGYDAIISTLPDTALLIQQADCQGLLLAAPQKAVIAAIHCGWRGSVCNIIATTVQVLHRDYGVQPATLRAVISPSLGPCCAEFVNYLRELPEWMHAFQVRPNYFDFWAISQRQLIDAGLLPEHIEAARRCTRCDERFFSYRRAAQTGRNGSLIGLAPHTR
ncbi:MAG: peptidoglycan editing factor PgeF [Desulfobulbus sp.]|jgi:YfiH family protein